MVGCGERDAKQGYEDRDYLHQKKDCTRSCSGGKVCSVEVVEEFVCEEKSSGKHRDRKD